MHDAVEQFLLRSSLHATRDRGICPWAMMNELRVSWTRASSTVSEEERQTAGHLRTRGTTTWRDGFGLLFIFHVLPNWAQDRSKTQTRRQAQAEQTERKTCSFWPRPGKKRAPVLAPHLGLHWSGPLAAGTAGGPSQPSDHRTAQLPAAVLSWRGSVDRRRLSLPSSPDHRGPRPSAFHSPTPMPRWRSDTRWPREVPVLVCASCYNQIPQAGWFRQQTLSHSARGWKSKIMALPRSCGGHMRGFWALETGEGMCMVIKR